MNRILCNLVLLVCLVSSLQAQVPKQPTMEENMKWVEAQIEGLNEEKKDKDREFDLVFEYNHQENTCVYTHVYNHEGESETTDFSYTFHLADIQLVENTENGVVLKARDELPLIEKKSVHPFADLPFVRYERVSSVDIISKADPISLKEKLQKSIESAEY